MDQISILFIGGMLVVMWLFFIRPQQKQQKQAADFQKGLEKGARVVTTGGIHGRVVKVDDNSVLMEIDNNVKMRVQRSAISLEHTKAEYPDNADKKEDSKEQKS